jgi:hypothetical protein
MIFLRGSNPGVPQILLPAGLGGSNKAALPMTGAHFGSGSFHELGETRLDETNTKRQRTMTVEHIERRTRKSKWTLYSGQSANSSWEVMGLAASKHGPYSRDRPGEQNDQGVDDDQGEQNDQGVNDDQGANMVGGSRIQKRCVRDGQPYGVLGISTGHNKRHVQHNCKGLKHSSQPHQIARVMN